MLAIKLQRIGRRHQPSYRIVVAEKRSKLKSPPVADLGAYDPVTKQATFDPAAAMHWLKVGARPTPTMHNLLVKAGALNAPKVKIKMKAKPASAEAPAGDAVPVETAPETAANETAVAEEKSATGEVSESAPETA